MIVVPGEITLAADRANKLDLESGNGNNTITIHDADNYQTVLGNTGLVATRTGDTRSTSAASIVFFDPRGNVISRIP